MPKSLYSTESAVLRGRLRAVREEAGITQAQLAKAMGQHAIFVSQVERGVRRLDVVELWHYCCALGLDMSEFIAEFQAEIESRRIRRTKPVRPDPARPPRLRS